MSHKFHKSIIRAYDIRGIYNETLFDQDAFYVAKSFASFLNKNGKNKIVVASDARKSSPALKENLIKGLVESGLEVIDVGIGPTPMLYFSIYHLNCDAGIMVTGSHNPKNHNGFKIGLKERPFYGDDIVNLAKIVENADFVDGSGTLSTIDVEDKYVDKITSDSIIRFNNDSLLDEIDGVEKTKYKIAWDCGNGAAGNVAKKISKKINADHFLLYEELDGDFPNHHPDPTVEENLQDLKKLIAKEKCDIGIAFDGDADRIGVVDDEGEVLWGDQLLVFYAREILQHAKGSPIIADVKASKVLFDEIKKAGGEPVMYKTGHSLVKAKMKELKSPLAGEMSGHIFFADLYLADQNMGYDDALYAAVRIINVLVKSGKKLSDLRKELPQTFSTPEYRIEVDDEEKFVIVDKIKSDLAKEKTRFSDIDGVRADSELGWWLIRASNTQAALSARCEGTSQENLEKLKRELKVRLEQYGVDTNSLSS